MTKSEEKDFNVFVGAETGILKGLNLHAKGNICKNLHNLKTLDKTNEVTALNFGESEQEVLLGLRNQTVKVYDAKFKSFSSSVETPGGSGPLVGVCRHQEALVTASEGGVLTYWRFSEEKKKAVDVIEDAVRKSGKLKGGGREDMSEEEVAKHVLKLREGRKLCRMRQCPEASSLVGVGGKETELQVWDLDRPDEGPIFTAKNVAPDKLQLRVPVWVSDLAWMSPNEVAICSRHGHIRLYDIREGSRRRRPVSSLEWPEDCGPVANSAMCRVTDKTVAVGTSGGLLGLWDFRTSAGYRGLVRKFGGCVGGVTSVTSAGDEHLLAVGLDRFLRVWKVGAGGRKPAHKLYLKSRLNCVLVTKDFNPDRLDDGEEDEDGRESEDECMIIEEDEDEVKAEDEDELWASLPVIDGGKRKSKSVASSKKLKR